MKESITVRWSNMHITAAKVPLRMGELGRMKRHMIQWDDVSRLTAGEGEESAYVDRHQMHVCTYKVRSIPFTCQDGTFPCPLWHPQSISRARSIVFTFHSSISKRIKRTTKCTTWICGYYYAPFSSTMYVCIPIDLATFLFPTFLSIILSIFHSTISTLLPLSASLL